MNRLRDHLYNDVNAEQSTTTNDSQSSRLKELLNEMIQSNPGSGAEEDEAEIVNEGVLPAEEEEPELEHTPRPQPPAPSRMNLDDLMAKLK